MVNAVAHPAGSGTLSWLVERFVTTTRGARHALAVAADGRPLGASTGTDPTTNTRLAEVVTKATGLTGSAATWISGEPVVSCLLTNDGGLLLVVPIPGGGNLAVVADGDADAGQVGYEATLAAGHLGEAVAAATTTSAATTSATGAEAGTA